LGGVGRGLTPVCKRSWAGALARALALAIAAACSSAVDRAGSGGGGGDGIFTTSSGSGGGGQVTGGPVVALMELSAPAQSEFILHGTLPVPRGTFPRADGKLPFSVRNADGYVVPTQIEIVSRYPRDADGADVIEILARVDRPAGVAPGARIRYSVVQHIHPSGKLPVMPSVLALLSAPGSVALTATDCFGHQYTVDLLKDMRAQTPGSNVRILRKGQVAVQMRNYGTMLPSAATPIGAPSGALPHFFGVHTYATAWALEDVLSLDLRVNNGASGRDSADVTDNPLGEVYFKSIDLWVPNGWTLLTNVSDPYFGTPTTQGAWTVYPIVKPNSNGTLHIMPSQGMFNRRLALARSGAVAAARSILDEEGLAFCRRGTSPDGGDLYSWWNMSTARYGTLRHVLPNLSYLQQAQIETRLANDWANIKNHLEQGIASSYPLGYPAMGWAHPWGVKYGGMTSGSEIWFYDGAKIAEAGSNKGYRAAQYTHRMYCDRQPQVLYDKDGEHTKLASWLVQGNGFQYFPALFFQTLLSGNDPFGFNAAPTFQVTWVRNQNKAPSYESELLAYTPIDFQHYIRFTRSPKVLAWLGNDALAKDDLRGAAEIFRLSYNEHANSANGSAIVSGLRDDILYVQNRPGRGFSFGRGPSWGIDSALAAYSLSDPAWRNQWRPWFGLIADTISTGQSSCNKFIQSHVTTKNLSGQFHTRQSIEQAIIENMLLGMCESVFRDVDGARFAETRDALSWSVEAMIGPMAWNPTIHAPNAHIAVAPLDPQLPPYCGSLPPGGFGNGGDSYMTWSSFGYGFELTGDPVYYAKAAEMAGTTPANLLNAMQGMGFNNVENRAGLIAALQN
jgi:hypothetical protein